MAIRSPGLLEQSVRHLPFCLCFMLPLAAAHWEPLGPFGGSAAIVEVDGHHRGTALAATANGLLFRSLDYGESWKPLSFPAELRATLHAFVVDPWNDGVYFAGLSSESAAYSGLFVSADGGMNWKRMADPRLKSVWSIALYPEDSRIMAVGNERGVFLSDDAGETWNEITPAAEPAMHPVVSLSFDPADSKIIYVGTPHLAWKTVDRGETWDSIHSGMLDDSDVFSILVDSRQRRRIFAGTCGGIYRSLNRGGQWSQLNQPTGAYRTYFVAQHPRIPNVLFAGTAGGLLRSSDTGNTWQKITSDSTRSIAFDPWDPDRIFVATDDAGLFRSEDLGDSFEAINRGFGNRSFTSMVGVGDTVFVHSRNSDFAAILARSKGDNEWHEIELGLDLERTVKLQASDAGVLYATTPEKVFVSADRAESWTSLVGPATESSLKEVLFASLDGRTVLVTSGDGVYRTLDAGDSWEPAGWTNEVDIYGVVSTRSNGLLAASSRGLLRSRDGGRSWSTVAGKLATGTVRAICKDSARTGHLYASQYGTLFESRDEGRSWRVLLTGGEGLQPIQEILVVPHDPECLFVLIQNRGVYRIDLTDR